MIVELSYRSAFGFLFYFFSFSLVVVSKRQQQHVQRNTAQNVKTEIKSTESNWIILNKKKKAGYTWWLGEAITNSRIYGFIQQLTAFGILNWAELNWTIPANEILCVFVVRKTWLFDPQTNCMVMREKKAEISTNDKQWKKRALVTGNSIKFSMSMLWKHPRMIMINYSVYCWSENYSELIEVGNFFSSYFVHFGVEKWLFVCINWEW